MIPKKMDEYLRDQLPQAAIDRRLRRRDGKCFLEFGHTDELLLARLGITVDKLGPRLVVCAWDEVATSIESTKQLYGMARLCQRILDLIICPWKFLEVRSSYGDDRRCRGQR